MPVPRETRPVPGLWDPFIYSLETDPRGDYYYPDSQRGNLGCGSHITAAHQGVVRRALLPLTPDHETPGLCSEGRDPVSLLPSCMGPAAGDTSSTRHPMTSCLAGPEEQVRGSPDPWPLREPSQETCCAPRCCLPCCVPTEFQQGTPGTQGKGPGHCRSFWLPLDCATDSQRTVPARALGGC